MSAISHRAPTGTRQSAMNRREQPIAASAKLTTERVFKYKDIGNRWHSRLAEHTWRGYIGVWRNVHDPAADETQEAMRTWRWRDSSRTVVDQTNVYTLGRFGSAARESDGLHQRDFVYQGKMLAPESQEEPVSSANGSLVVLDSCCYANFGRFWLPEVAMTPGADCSGARAALAAAVEAAGKSPSPITPDVWGMELFLTDGECRWSLPLVYDGVTGKLSRVVLIQEYDCTADPTSLNVLAACRGSIQETRAPLGDDPAVWVTRGSVGRRVARLRHDSASKQLLLGDSLQEPVEWECHGGSHQPAGPTGELLLRMPDAMYVRVPASIAAPEREGAQQPSSSSDSSSGNSNNGSNMYVFEFGGLLRHLPAGCSGAAGTGLQRVVVRYDRATGELVDVSREVFTPPPLS